jgi:hypothetical protein
MKQYYVDQNGVLWYNYVGGNRWMLAKNPKRWLGTRRINNRIRAGWFKLTPIYPSPEQLQALLVLTP